MKKKLLVGLATGLFLVGMAGLSNATSLVIDNLDTANVIVNPSGGWTHSTHTGGYNGTDYQHDGQDNTGIDFTFLVGNVVTGNYQLELLWTAWSNRATNVPVDVYDIYGTHAFSVDQSGSNSNPNPASIILGTFSFDSSSKVVLGTNGVDGYVIADAVRLTQMTESGQEPVPEPATMLLLGTGLTGIAGSRIRKKKKASMN